MWGITIITNNRSHQIKSSPSITISCHSQSCFVILCCSVHERDLTSTRNRCDSSHSHMVLYTYHNNQPHRTRTDIRWSTAAPPGREVTSQMMMSRSFSDKKRYFWLQREGGLVGILFYEWFGGRKTRPPQDSFSSLYHTVINWLSICPQAAMTKTLNTRALNMAPELELIMGKQSTRIIVDDISFEQQIAKIGAHVKWNLCWAHRTE